MADEPRQNDRLLKMVKTTYEKSLFVGDKGMWTIFEIVKRPIARWQYLHHARTALEALDNHDSAKVTP